MGNDHRFVEEIMPCFQMELPFERRATLYCTCELYLKAYLCVACFSQTGKRLMAKCRMLLQENEELGKVISSGRTAKLEGEIALEKTLVQEMKKSQAGKICLMIYLKQLFSGTSINLSQKHLFKPSQITSIKISIKAGINVYCFCRDGRVFSRAR